jgi:hypothetical protein
VIYALPRLNCQLPFEKDEPFQYAYIFCQFNMTHRDLLASQDAIVALVSIPGAMLSIIGLSLILVQVWKHCWNSKNKAPMCPYQQLLGGLSLCDILFSCTNVVRVFILLDETSSRTLAKGHNTTCRALGFFHNSLSPPCGTMDC